MFKYHFQQKARYTNKIIIKIKKLLKINIKLLINLIEFNKIKLRKIIKDRNGHKNNQNVII